MNEIAVVRYSVVRAVLNAFEARGGDKAAMRKRHGIGTLSDPYGLIPMARYLAMFEEMAEELDDPLFGANLGTSLLPIDLGPAGLLIARSASMKSALARMSNYNTSFQSATQSDLTHSDDLMLWTYRIADKSLWPRRQDAEFTMSSLIQLLRSGFDRKWKPYAVHFEHAGLGKAHECAATNRMRTQRQSR